MNVIETKAIFQSSPQKIIIFSVLSLINVYLETQIML